MFMLLRTNPETGKTTSETYQTRAKAEALARDFRRLGWLVQIIEQLALA